MKKEELDLKKFFQRIDITGSIGLIVKKSPVSLEEILEDFQFPYLFYTVEKDIYADDFLKKLVEAFRSKKWFIVEVKHTYFPGPVYNQLRLIDRLGRIQILNLEGEKEVLDMKMPQESRLVLIMEKDILDNFEIPNVLNLIGPIKEV